jgi:hypothetical protein
MTVMTVMTPWTRLKQANCSGEMITINPNPTWVFDAYLNLGTSPVLRAFHQLTLKVLTEHWQVQNMKLPLILSSGVDAPPHLPGSSRRPPSPPSPWPHAMDALPINRGKCVHAVASSTASWQQRFCDAGTNPNYRRRLLRPILAIRDAQDVRHLPYQTGLPLTAAAG